MFKRYSGGKGQYGVYQRIINLMPPHEVYIETHLGGGAIMRNKLPAGRNIGIELDPKVIQLWRQDNSLDVELINDDAVNYLKGYQFTGKELIYCDPPYLRGTRKKRIKLYKHEYTVEQHIELLEVIKTLPCTVMLSGYESPLYRETLNGWHSHIFQAGCHHGMGTEWLWMNYPAPVELHDYRYLGDNFRQREKIKKKTGVWVRKFQSMPVLERQALLHAIDSVRNNNNE
ncbi:MAG: DNA adenine methylase [Gammaproteobacteria bacterium]|nr:DNA adenine methylase [Gammaproteobacteria bacterium]